MLFDGRENDVDLTAVAGALHEWQTAKEE